MELDYWINDHRPPASSSWSKAFWNYTDFIRRLMAKHNVEVAEVVGTYIERTPPPSEALLMPVVRIAFPTAFFVIQYSFDRYTETWTVSVASASPILQPTYELFDQDADVRRIGVPGFPEGMLFPCLRRSASRFTCQVHDEWDVAMLVQLVLRGPRVPEEIIEARRPTTETLVEEEQEAVIWVAGPKFARANVNQLEWALGFALMPPEGHLDDLEFVGRIFGIQDGAGGQIYPAFQFDEDGQPLPIIGQLLDEIANAIAPVSGWSLAQWMMAQTPSLEGSRPLDLVDLEPARVRKALRSDLLRKRGLKSGSAGRGEIESAP